MIWLASQLWPAALLSLIAGFALTWFTVVRPSDVAEDRRPSRPRRGDGDRVAADDFDDDDYLDVEDERELDRGVRRRREGVPQRDVDARGRFATDPDETDRYDADRYEDDRYEDHDAEPVVLSRRRNARDERRDQRRHDHDGDDARRGVARRLGGDDDDTMDRRAPAASARRSVGHSAMAARSEGESDEHRRLVRAERGDEPEAIRRDHARAEGSAADIDANEDTIETEAFKAPAVGAQAAHTDDRGEAVGEPDRAAPPAAAPAAEPVAASSESSQPETPLPESRRPESSKPENRQPESAQPEGSQSEQPKQQPAPRTDGARVGRAFAPRIEE